MHANPRLAGVLVSVSLAIGCSHVPSAPTSPSAIGGGSTALTADQLASGTWTLVAMQPSGQAEQPAPSGATYTLTFTNGQLSTHVDCNTCAGSYSLSGQTLTIGPNLACTRAACLTMEFENTYTRLISGDSAASLTGGTLVLSSPRGVLRFTR